MATAGGTVNLSRIGQICMIVHDMKKAIAFYREALGVKFLFEAPNMAFFDCDGVRLMLGLPDRPELDHPGSILYFKVENIQGAFDTLSSRGVRFIVKPHLVARMPDHDLWLADFKDLDGNILALMSEVRHA
jgi:methylmalonyl-CoA/ethylmalonyl-CoA epimerase